MKKGKIVIVTSDPLELINAKKMGWDNRTGYGP